MAMQTVVFAAESGADQTAPLVTDVTIVTGSVNKPGTIQLSMNVVEEETGIQYIQVGLYCYKSATGSPLLIFGDKSYVNEESSAFTGTIALDIPVSQSDAAGTYYVGNIIIRDNAGNERVYFDHYNASGYHTNATGSYLPCYGQTDATNACYINNGGTISVISNGDDTAPIVTEAQILTPSVAKPGTIQLQMDVIEESQIKDVEVGYGGMKGKQPLMIAYYPIEWSISGNTITANVAVSEDHTSGTYYVSHIILTDTEGNTRRYDYDSTINQYYKDDTGSYLQDTADADYKCYIKDGAVATVQSTGDDVAPIIETITMQTHTVKKPGVLPIHLKFAEADELKMITVYLRRLGGTEQDILNYTKEYATKESKSEITLKMPIATDTVSAEYYVERIELKDYSGNERMYFNDAVETGYGEKDGKAFMDDHYDDTVIAYFAENKAIVVEDEFDVAFELSLSNKKLLNKINSMEEGKTGRIYIDGKGIATKDLFEAIKGKDKTLVFYKDSYQWVFNGKDVSSPKDIKLKIKMEMVDGTEYNGPKQLLQIDFEDNGELPGKANVRIKSDYVYEVYELSEAMYLYYLNPDSEKLEYEKSSDIEYILDGTDHWCQFDITHNSTYMVSSEKIVKVKKIKITGLSKQLAVGKKMKLTTTVTPKNATKKSVKWKSSNTKYATVNSKGVVTAKKAGIGKTVTITATAKDGSKKKATYKIKIMRHAVKSVKATAKTSLKVGKKLTIKTVVKTTGKDANKKLQFTSSNTKYATVNAKGVVTAKKAGKGKTVTITVMATDGSGKKATVKIKIK